MLAAKNTPKCILTTWVKVRNLSWYKKRIACPFVGIFTRNKKTLTQENRAIFVESNIEFENNYTRFT